MERYLLNEHETQIGMILPRIRAMTVGNRHESCQCHLRSLVTYCEYSGDEEDKFRSLILCGWG